MKCAAAILAVLAALGGRPAAPAAEANEKTADGVSFLVLPITSDEEGLGDQVRLMLRNKAKRLGAVVYDPSSIDEVLGGEAITVATPPDKLAAIARDRFQADILVTGHVKGKGKGPYDIRLVAVRVDKAGKPQVMDKTYTCGYHQIVAIEMAKAVYGIFGMAEPADPMRMLREDAEVEKRWREGPNLVRNAGFEQPNGRGNGPADWQDLEDQMAWTPKAKGTGKSLKFDMNKGTAESYGLDYYSDWIPIEPGATYRFSVRYLTLGPTPKIFLKGYHSFPPQEGFPAQRREIYRRQVHPSGPKEEWNTVTADFIPTSLKPGEDPTYLKVDLYAYLGAGVIYWDDVVLKKVRDAPSATADTKAPQPKPPK
jgi:hypothetical protein